MTEAATTSHPACNVDKLATQYNDLIAALTSSIEDPGAKDVADKLMLTREAFIAACNDLHDELVELKQRLSQPTAGAQPARTRDHPQQQTITGQTERMEIDDEQQPEHIAATLSQQHEAFLSALQPSAAALAGNAAMARGNNE